MKADIKKINFIVFLILIFNPFKILSADFETSLIFPDSNKKFAVQYEKLEIGIKLNSDIEQQINNFILGIYNPESLNPFNPDDIDIRAEFFHPENINNTSILKFGFFYLDFERKAHYWQRIFNPYRFRIRFSPPYPGSWICQISIRIKNSKLLFTQEIAFECLESDNEPFVSVSENNRFLKIGDKSFFPVGQNLPSPKCYLCPDSIYCAGIEPWCPITMLPPGYEIYLKEIEILKEKGANYFRICTTPWNLDIEFEKLGNYYDRMNCAWEMDKILEKAKEVDIRIHLSLQSHFPFENPNPYHMHYWDWTPNHFCVYNPEKDKGYCYGRELHLASPVDFLTDSLAKRYYKNKIRYMISRYGYSTQIGILELFGEINNIGSEYEYNSDCEFVKRSYYPYPNPSVQLAIAEWHNEMSTFIKKELQHTDHLLAINFAGQPEKNDYSFLLPNVDVNSYNSYAPRVMWTNIANEIFPVTELGKPLLFSETGAGIDKINNCDNDIHWFKNAWLTSFSGLAGTGMSWNNEHNYEVWHHLGNIREFIGNLDFGTGNWVVKKDVTENLLAEMLCLFNLENQTGIGVVSNTTTNFFTQNINFDENTSGCLKHKPEDPIFQVPSAVSPEGGDNAFKLIVKPFEKYIIEWYNAYYLEPLKTTEESSDIRGNLYLNLPNILSGNEKEKSIFAFKIKIKDSIDNQTSEKVVVFPNPTNDSIKIKIDKNSKAPFIHLVSIDGKLLFERKINELITEIDLSQYVPGLYFLIIRDQGKNSGPKNNKILREFSNMPLNLITSPFLVTA